MCRNGDANLYFPAKFGHFDRELWLNFEVQVLEDCGKEHRAETMFKPPMRAVNIDPSMPISCRLLRFCTSFKLSLKMNLKKTNKLDELCFSDLAHCTSN
jgi:hypothetical protein